MENILNQIDNLIKENDTNKSKIKDINEKLVLANKEINELEGKLEISTKAIEVLRGVSESTVQSSYQFLEQSINDVLKQVFEEKREVKITETVVKGQYPQVELSIMTSTGEVGITNDGRGIMQIISLLTSICLIILTGSRRFMALDEVLSGLSSDAYRIVDLILHDFCEKGFCFIINEHNFIPKGAKVYVLETENGTTGVARDYIETKGQYGISLDGYNDNTPKEIDELPSLGSTIENIEENEPVKKKTTKKKETSEDVKKKAKAMAAEIEKQPLEIV